MNYRMICRVLGWILLIYAALMLLPLAAGLWYGENVLNFIIATAPKQKPRTIHRRMRCPRRPRERQQAS